jgi:peptidoglycan/xylan/chitin deacetylase (PgdA/CDA1 family)
MRFVSPLLKRAVYPALHRTGWLDRFTPTSGYAVVNYHGVIPEGYSGGEKFLDGNLVRAQVLRKQLQFLKAHYQVIHPEDFRGWIEQGKALPARSVLVTCDDGLLNTLTDMLPVLQDEEVPCLFFVTAASCGDDPGMLWYEELYHLMRQKPLSEVALELPVENSAQVFSSENFQAQWWSVVRRASQLDAEARAEWMRLVRAQCGPAPARFGKRWRLLNGRELERLSGELSQGGMSIGAHTRTHPVLSLCGDEEAEREICGSKLGIERTLGRAVWAFAYPFGNPSTLGDREFRLARQAGYSCAFLNVEHWGGQESNPFAIVRTHVTSDMSLAEFAAHVSGVHVRLQRVVSGGSV